MGTLNELLLLGGAPPTGALFSTFKAVVMLLLLPPWLYAAAWINRDAQRYHFPQMLWNGLTLGLGALGVLLWLVVPLYAVGLLLYLVLAGGVVFAYVTQRNKRAGEGAKVFTAQHLSSVFARSKRQQIEVVQRLKLYNHMGKPEPPPAEEDEPELLQAYNVTQELLHDAVTYRASRAELIPAGEQMTVRFQIDGVYHKRAPLDRQEASLAVDYLKRIAGLDVQEKRKPQTGSISMDAGAVRADMNVTSDGTTQGQRLRLQVIQELAQTRLEDLGMADGLRERVEKINALEAGLTIVSGQKGQGVTSTLYSLMRKHDAFMKQLVTLEGEVTVDLDNITQQTYQDAAEMTANFASLVRRDPDVIMVDACKTAQAGKAIAETAAAKRVLLGLTAENSFVALAKWIKLCGDRQTAVGPLKAITCQVLLRKLCPQCREAYRPPQNILAKLNLPADKIERFYRPPTKPLTDEKGNPVVCPTCRGTGYHGRTAAFELLELTDDIRELIVRDGSLSQIKSACRKNKMLYLQEQSLRKVIAGVTSIEDVVRVSKKQ